MVFSTILNTIICYILCEVFGGVPALYYTQRLRLMGYYGGWSLKPQLGLSNSLLGSKHISDLPHVIPNGQYLHGAERDVPKTQIV